MSLHIYDRQGRRISAEKYHGLHHEEYMRVGLDEVRGVSVSTVWTGIDHSYGSSEKPFIFETMIFGGGDGIPPSHAELTYRYSTEEEAIAGHRGVVVRILSGDHPLSDYNIIR